MRARIFGASLVGTLALLAGGASGCDWGKFDEFETQASTIVLEKPEGYPRGGFGTRLYAYEGTTGGMQVSRLAVNAGGGSPPQIYAVWTGTGVDLSAALFSICDGGGGGSCSGEAGAGLAGTSVGGTPCALVGEPDLNEVSVSCESSGMRGLVTLPTAGERFGEAIAGLPEGLASAVVGAPAAAGGGKLYTINITAGGLSGTATPLAGLDRALMGAGANLGSRVVATPAPGGAMIATSSHLATNGRVVWALVTGPGTAEVRACVDAASAPLLGRSMALGRLVGDATPDLALGVQSPSGPADRAGVVAVYDGGMLPGACEAPTRAPLMIACPDGLSGISCAESGFGDAVAMGDVDADGDDDLVIGAPFATVNGTVGAGAVYVVAGPLTAAPAASDFEVLTDSSPDEGGHLGASLALPRTKIGGIARAEIAAGAPDADTVYVFLCSGLGMDTPAIGPRCIPM